MFDTCSLSLFGPTVKCSGHNHIRQELRKADKKIYREYSTSWISSYIPAYMPGVTESDLLKSWPFKVTIVILICVRVKALHLWKCMFGCTTGCCQVCYIGCSHRVSLSINQSINPELTTIFFWAYAEMLMLHYICECYFLIAWLKFVILRLLFDYF